MESPRKLLAAFTLLSLALSNDVQSSDVSAMNSSSIPTSPRKLLQKEAPTRRPDKMGPEVCSNEDILVFTNPTPAMPNGIPTYTVEIINVCSSGCAVSGVHLRCGWFASYRLINPRLFRRLKHDDCLVNDGKPIPSGGSVSFAYANSFPYELDVASLACV